VRRHGSDYAADTGTAGVRMPQRGGHLLDIWRSGFGMSARFEGSTKVVYAALAGNVAIAAAKLIAFGLSGSGPMLAEGIHSLVDSLNQVLLLIGEWRGRRAPDPDHPLGHGMETYFWSFIVAIMVLLLGGGASLYEGVHRLIEPTAPQSATMSFVVLGIAAIFEGSTLAFGYREFKRVVRGREISLWSFIQKSKDPNLFATLLEDWAALIGIAIASLGVLGASVLHVQWADGAATLGIGVLLSAVALVLANECRSLIAGEAVTPRLLADIKRQLSADSRIRRVTEIATLHLGPTSVLVALTMDFASQLTLAEVHEATGELTAALQRLDDRIARVYVRPVGPSQEPSATRPLPTGPPVPESSR
jgi:cation diffusion facilitator family transporter